MFGQHLRDMPSDGPIIATFREINKKQLAFRPNSVLLQCLKIPSTGNESFQLPMVEFIQDKSEKSALSRRLKKYHIQRYKEKGVMSAMITESAKTHSVRGAGYDRLMRYPHQKTRKLALHYRTNHAFMEGDKLCPGCGRKYNRGHIKDCKIGYDQMTHLQKHMAEENHREMGETYNLLDVAINTQKWNTVNKVINILDITLNIQYAKHRQDKQQELKRKYYTGIVRNLKSAKRRKIFK